MKSMVTNVSTLTTLGVISPHTTAKYSRQPDRPIELSKVGVAIAGERSNNITVSKTSNPPGTLLITPASCANRKMAKKAGKVNSDLAPVASTARKLISGLIGQVH
jgi:hypothetical protein